MMQSWIEYPAEPKELLLAWQAPDRVQDRLRWAVGRLTALESGAVFDYLDGKAFDSLNLGRTRAALEQAGYAGYPAFDPRRRPAGGFRDNVLETFLRRLPPAGRRDFPAYLAYHNVPMALRLSAMALLAITEARLPSDGFSLVDPLDGAAECVDLVFEVAGFRYCVDEGTEISVGDPCMLEPDPTNELDPAAVQVKAGGRRIGYVNRLQAQTIAKWLNQRNIACWIARRSAQGGPPRAFAFLKVRPLQTAIAA